jgi:hypothetical protein
MKIQTLHLINPRATYGADAAKELFNTKAMGKFVLIGQNLNDDPSPVEAVLKLMKGRLALQLELSPITGKQSEYRLKWADKYNFSGIYTTEANAPHLGCGQFNASKKIGTKITIDNPLATCASYGLLFIFSDEPSKAKALTILLIPNGRMYVQHQGVKDILAGLYETQLCQMKQDIQEVGNYPVSFQEAWNLACPDDNCLSENNFLYLGAA